MNKHDVREVEFAQRRAWIEKFDSDTLRKLLATGRFHGGQATVAREVLRAREDKPE